MPSPDRPSRHTEPVAPRRGRRPTLSLEAVVRAAVTLLDEAGEEALTFRALAARLDTGVGSLYHYVGGREELLDRATNEVIGHVIAHVTLPPEPFAALRTLSLETYRAMQEHRWVGSYLMRDHGMQPNSMRLFELFGQQVLSLDLTDRQRFDAVSALVSYAVGCGAELRELPASVTERGVTQREYLAEMAEAWQELDATEFPFVHSVAASFAEHDDVDQFMAGVDLFLSGVAELAGSTQERHP